MPLTDCAEVKPCNWNECEKAFLKRAKLFRTLKKSLSAEYIGKPFVTAVLFFFLTYVRVLTGEKP